MGVIARDAVASDHLVYAWPFPIGPECEVACGHDEEVVMCPAWTVGDRLGPGHHVWRSHSPMHPVSAFFVRTAPVDCTFDMTTGFVLPTTGQPIRLRAAGVLQVRCADPGLLIAQFVGLPFDAVNDGVLRSVSRSIERMLARLLTRRVVMSGSPIAVTDPGMLPGIVEELIAYNPTAGAVFGVDLMQIHQLVIGADDGNAPYVMLPQPDWSQPQVQPPQPYGINGEPMPQASAPDISMTETARGHARPPTPVPEPQASVSGEIVPKSRPGSVPPDDRSSIATSGEILVQPKGPVPEPLVPGASGTHVEPHKREEITQPGVRPARTTMQGHLSGEITPKSTGATSRSDAHGAIVGIGIAPIGEAASSSPAIVAGEIPSADSNVSPGGRVMFPGPNGLMQSATVRQLLRGYYELEVGSTGELVWVPVTGVVPE